MASLKLEKVVVNENGWGPVDVPEDLVNVPFAPFTKSDKVGRACDWTSSNFPRIQAARQGQTNVFNFAMDNEDSNFHLVDSRPTRSKGFGQRRHHQHFQHNKRNADKDDYRTLNPGGNKPEQRHQRAPPHQRRPNNFWREQRNMVQYSPSINIRPEWSVLEQVQVPLLAKLSLAVDAPTDYLQAGVLSYYEKTIDRVSPRSLVPLAKTSCAFRSVSASDDPVLKKMASEGKARVFITDSVLTALMCTPRSVYSWDVIITRRGNQLWFDKRPNSVLDKESVNETAPEGVQEDDSINGVAQLAQEATAVRQNFSQQALDRSQTCDLGAPNPFKSGSDKEELASVGYRYRTWNLGEDMDLAVRCEVDGIINRQGTDQLLTIRTFNQAVVGPSDVDWKRKLEHQSAAVLAMEVKNNSNRVARWTLSSLLADCDMMKIGFATRVSPKDNHNHLLLGTQMQKPKDLATQLNIKLGNCWAIVRYIIDLCFKLEKEHYVLMKDPNKQLMYLYEIPSNALSTGAGDGDDDATPLPDA